MKNFEQAVKDYEWRLGRFIRAHELPKEWFAAPDHLAIKCFDAADYESERNIWRPLTIQGKISEIVMNNRRLGTAELAAAVSVGMLGKVTWIEIMEPRPEKVGKDVVGLEHMEFCYPNFAEVTAHLDKQGIEYKMEENPGHAWVNIVLNKYGQELKINNRTLADVVPQELADGISYWV